MAQEKTIDEIDAEYKTLSARREQIVQNKLRLEAECNTRKRLLREAMQECKDAGFDPNNLQDEIRRAKEVLTTKMDIFRAELDAADELMKPMLRELGG